VYLNLASADREGALAAAIAADTRSYEPSMFPEAARVGGGWGVRGVTCRIWGGKLRHSNVPDPEGWEGPRSAR
jgi:hypothetical protein